MVERFLFWCLVINTGVYTLTAIALFTLREFVYRVQSKVFHFDRESTDRAAQSYMANYKLLITALNFTPWLAVVIINRPPA